MTAAAWMMTRKRDKLREESTGDSQPVVQQIGAQLTHSEGAANGTFGSVTRQGVVAGLEPARCQTRVGLTEKGRQP